MWHHCQLGVIQYINDIFDVQLVINTAIIIGLPLYYWYINEEGIKVLNTRNYDCITA